MSSSLGVIILTVSVSTYTKTVAPYPAVRNNRLYALDRPTVTVCFLEIHILAEIDTVSRIATDSTKSYEL